MAEMTGQNLKTALDSATTGTIPMQTGMQKLDAIKQRAIFDSVTGAEKLKLVKDLRDSRSLLSEAESGIEKLQHVKRIKDIRSQLGVKSADAPDPLATARVRIQTDEFKKLQKTFAGDLGTINAIDEGRMPGYTRSLFVNSVTGKLSRLAPKDPLLVGLLLAWIFDAQKQFKKPPIANKNSVWQLVPDFNQYLPLFAKAEAEVAPVGNETTKETNQSDEEVTASTNAQAQEAIQFLRGFIGTQQINAILSAMRGEEKQFFFDKMVGLQKLIQGMPKTYDTDGQGDKAIAYLHYFKGSGDWYVTEKDSEGEQLQAFGLADLGYPEMGYISIVELIKHNVEIDLYWTPKSIEAIKGKDDVPESSKDPLNLIDRAASEGYAKAKELGEMPKYVPDWIDEIDNGDQAIIDAYMLGARRWLNEQSETTSNQEQGDGMESFESELTALQGETDIPTYLAKLEEIAGRIEAAGLMEALDAKLNETADKLTALMAEAEKSPSVEDQVKNAEEDKSRDFDLFLKNALDTFKEQLQNSGNDFTARINTQESLDFSWLNDKQRHKIDSEFGAIRSAYRKRKEQEDILQIANNLITKGSPSVSDSALKYLKSVVKKGVVTVQDIEKINNLNKKSTKTVGGKPSAGSEGEAYRMGFDLPTYDPVTRRWYDAEV